MKKMVFFSATLIAFGMMSCTGGQTGSGGGNDSIAGDSTTTEVSAESEYNDWPWDFPKASKIDVAEGQMVLAPYTFYSGAVEDKKDLTNASLIFYNSAVKAVNADFVEFAYKEAKVPSSLIIPIPEGQTAQKGDVVVTWWQSGSGMEQAIVVDGGSEPKVNYLGLGYNEDGSGLATKFGNEQLKPNSFFVLENGAMQPGAPVAYKDGNKWCYGTLINKSADRALILGFASNIHDAALSDVKVVPVKPDYKVGDQVGYVFVDSFLTGTVKKIDMELGRVWIDGKNSDRIVSIIQVCKELAE